MELIVYKFFNPELLYMTDDELVTHFHKYGRNENRIYSFRQIMRNKQILRNLVDGYDFDWLFYIMHNSLNAINEEAAIKHYIESGFDDGLLANIKQVGIVNYEYGVNFFGYGGTIIGQGVSANSIVLALRTLHIPLVINNVNCKIQSLSLNKAEFSAPYKINVIHINPDRADIYLVLKSFMTNHINIGIWTWETEQMPEYWEKYTSWFDEIWTISDFTLGAIAKSSLCPVINIKPPIRITWNETGYGPDYITKHNLTNKFVYFYAFDYISYVERKNPYILIDACKMLNDDSTVLILKTMNMPRNLENEFVKNNISIINKSISPDEYFSLLNATHCYVSPHRSEGQGRTIMEAMYFGKKVIATGYSGNLDFCTVNTSYLIKWKYVTSIENGIYKGHRWADPNITHLVKLMKLAKKEFMNGQMNMNICAREQMLQNFTIKSCAETIHKRIQLHTGSSQ